MFKKLKIDKETLSALRVVSNFFGIPLKSDSYIAHDKEIRVARGLLPTIFIEKEKWKEYKEWVEFKKWQKQKSQR